MDQVAIDDDNLVEAEKNPKESWGEIVMLSTSHAVPVLWWERRELRISTGREFSPC